jgi:hypothetical protein
LCEGKVRERISAVLGKNRHRSTGTTIMETCTCVDAASYTFIEPPQPTSAKEHAEHPDTQTSGVMDRQPEDARKRGGGQAKAG